MRRLADTSLNQTRLFVDVHKHLMAKLMCMRTQCVSDLHRQIEERFQILSKLVCEGLLNQELLVELRREANLNNNSIDEQVCHVLIR